MNQTESVVVSETTSTHRVHRIEVRAQPHVGDPRAESIMRKMHLLPESSRPASVSRADVFLIAGTLHSSDLERIAHELLADLQTQSVHHGVAERVVSDAVTIEVHPHAGVTDPAAHSV